MKIKTNIGSLLRYVGLGLAGAAINLIGYMIEDKKVQYEIRNEVKNEVSRALNEKVES